MSLEVLISIVGAFGVVALSINAWFLKGIYTELNDVRIQMATMISSNQYLQNVINQLLGRVSVLEETCHEQQLEIERLKK